MVENSRDYQYTVDLQHLQRIISPAQPQIFRHRDLLRSVRNSSVIKQEDLINTLDHIHFTDGTILVHTSDPKYGEEFLLKARLDACESEAISCLWDEDTAPLPENTKLLHMIVADDLSLILFPIHATNFNAKGFTADLPEQAYLIGKRRVRRHVCRGIDVNFTQSGFTARGILIDFSPSSFRIRLKPEAGGSFIWMNEDSPCMIHLQRANRILFSGLCRCVRQTGTLFERELVLAPLEPKIQRFQKRKQRTPRLRIIPPLIARFEHPFCMVPVQLDICDLTFTGFSVEEHDEESVLVPGMIIPNLKIQYANALSMTCDAQVIHRRDAGKGLIRHGLAILDMNFRDYRQLSHLMVHAGDPQARFTSDLAMDNLWEFLFDTGFIYPKKYHSLQPCREEFKETYRKLYQEDQDIEAHFTYQKNGRIYGHVSIFRAYQRAWMVHHLAARPLKGKRTGLFVLKNVLRFFDGLYRYPSIAMDYMLFYFRPENHFPNLFFGGFSRDLGNPKACSLDLFAYLSHQTNNQQTPLPESWQLSDFMLSHMPELERFYRNISGGLMLDALPFCRQKNGEKPLEEIYRQKGFRRQWSVHSLMQENTLKAVMIVNHSDVGLNLSDLLNGITIIVVDSAGLSWDIMTAALSHLTAAYTTPHIPLLVYPSTYPGEQGIKMDKHYLLWILDSQYGKAYLDYMEQKTKMTVKFLFKYIIRKLIPK